jgi:hypothetical protein
VWWSLAKDQTKSRWRLRTASIKCLQLLTERPPVFSRIIWDKLWLLLQQPGLAWPVRCCVLCVVCCVCGVWRVSRELTQQHTSREKVMLLVPLVRKDLEWIPVVSKLPYYLNDTEVRYCVPHDHKRCTH